MGRADKETHRLAIKEPLLGREGLCAKNGEGVASKAVFRGVDMMNKQKQKCGFSKYVQMYINLSYVLTVIN